MEPEVANYRRILSICNLVHDVSVERQVSLQPVLRVRQPEGDTLLGYLSESILKIATLRRIILRNSEDLIRRKRLAEAIAGASANDREDIMRRRHSAGKPIYISDPDIPGKIVRIMPDKSRARGRIVGRVFVPDGE
jgi:hypothetical protein